MERQDGEPRYLNPQDTGDTPGVQKGDGPAHVGMVRQHASAVQINPSLIADPWVFGPNAPGWGPM